MMISLLFSRVAGVWKMNRKEITEHCKLCLYLHVSFHTWLIAAKSKCRLSDAAPPSQNSRLFVEPAAALTAQVTAQQRQKEKLQEKKQKTKS